MHVRNSHEVADQAFAYRDRARNRIESRSVGFVVHPDTLNALAPDRNVVELVAVVTVVVGRPVAAPVADR